MSQNKTKLCTNCNQHKPSIEFKRLLTLAQTRATLRQPNATTRYWADSKRCKSCQAELKRRTPMTVKEIRNKISSGDMHKDIGEAIIKQKREALPKKRSRVMKEYWQKKRVGWIDELKANLQKQVTRYASRYYSYKNQLGDTPTPTQHAMLDQHSYNYKEAQRIRKDLMDRAKSGEVVDTDTKINELIKRRKAGVV